MPRSLLVPMLLLAAAFASSGCPGNECAYDPKLPPVEGGLDCAPGSSCYLGQCFVTCNAGMERTPEESCTSSADCKHSERPNCVFVDTFTGSFCSTCEDNFACVLGLNICQPVADIPDPPIPSVMMSDVPLPLDGGQIDGSTFEDAGVENPIAENVEYAGYVSLLQVRHNGVDLAFGGAEFCDVRNTVQTQDMTLSANQSCELRVSRLYTGTSTPTDFGPVHFEPDQDTPSAMTIMAAAFAYQSGVRRYVVNMALPDRLLTYSTSPQSNHKYVDFKGDGYMTIADRWNTVNGGLIFVPYELVLDPPTEMLMGANVEVSLATPLDLHFAWTPLPIDAQDDDFGFKVIVEIGGERSPCANQGTPLERYFIHCQLTEAGNRGDKIIDVAASLISDYILAVNPAAGQRVSLRIGREHTESVLVNGSDFVPNTDPPRHVTSIIDVYFGQDFESEIVFVP